MCTEASKGGNLELVQERGDLCLALFSEKATLFLEAGGIKKRCFQGGGHLLQPCQPDGLDNQWGDGCCNQTAPCGDKKGSSVFLLNLTLQPAGLNRK